jgi:hypothetical protein
MKKIVAGQSDEPTSWQQPHKQQLQFIDYVLSTDYICMLLCYFSRCSKQRTDLVCVSESHPKASNTALLTFHSH